MSDQPVAEPLPDNTQHSLQTNFHASGWIRTYNLRKQAAAEPRLRPRGHRGRLVFLLRSWNYGNNKLQHPRQGKCICPFRALKSTKSSRMKGP